MIEIKCPACGAEGRAPKDKILTRLVCRKCLRVFHVTPSGMSVIGEPPTPGQSSSTAAQSNSTADTAVRVDQFIEQFSKRVSSPMTWLVIGGIILVAFVVGTFSSWRPEGLQERVARVAKAAVQGDLQTIESLTVSGTATAIGPWYVAIRPKSDELLKRPGSNNLGVDTEIKSKSSGETDVELVAWVYTSEDLERRGKALPDTTITAASASGMPISLPMFWRYEGWRGWRLDLERTLELTKAAQ